MSDEEQIRRVVANRLRKQLAPSARPIIDADAVNAIPEGGSLTAAAGTIFTPLAQTLLLERRIQVVTETQTPSVDNQTVALGADHGGYAMKEMLKTFLQAKYVVIDCGTHSTEAVDYPDLALAVAELVSSGRVWRGILIDGAGIGSCMAANKVPGVRASQCYDQATAVNSREHNDANVLTLGAGLIGDALAKQIVETWLKTEFGGGRHAKRVDKISAIERKYRG